MVAARNAMTTDQLIAIAPLMHAAHTLPGSGQRLLKRRGNCRQRRGWYLGRCAKADDIQRRCARSV